MRWWVPLAPLALIPLSCSPSSPNCADCSPGDLAEAHLLLSTLHAPKSALDEATLEVVLGAGKLQWSPSRGLAADAYLVFAKRDDGRTDVLARIAGTSMEVPENAQVVGVQPIRGARFGRLVVPGNGSTQAPLQGMVSPHLALRLEGGNRESDFVQRGLPSVKAVHADVHLAAEAPGVHGEATFDVISDGSQTFVFRLAEASTAATNASGTPLTSAWSGGKLTITLPSAPHAGDSVTLNVSYSIADARLNGGAGLMAESSDRDLYFAAGTALWPIPTWIMPDQADVTLTVDLPPGWTASSAGQVVSTSPVTIAPVDFVPFSWPALAAGPYSDGTASFGKHAVHVLALPIEDDTTNESATADFNASAARIYAGWGEPASSSVAIAAVSPQHGGTSNHGLILVPDYTLTGSLNPELEFFFAHELSHQWWGAVVHPASPLDLWLTEGMADWSALRVIEDQEGMDTANSMWTSERDQYLDLVANGYGGNPGRDVPVRPSDTSHLQDYVYYLKGALVLRHLESLVGRETFDAILKEYLAQYRYATAGTADFEALVEAKSGADLSWFWREWLEGTGLPSITYAPYFNPDDPNDVEVVVTQTGEGPFAGEPWTIPVRIETEGGSGYYCLRHTTEVIETAQGGAPDALSACAR